MSKVRKVQVEEFLAAGSEGVQLLELVAKLRCNLSTCKVQRHVPDGKSIEQNYVFFDNYNVCHFRDEPGSSSMSTLESSVSEEGLTGALKEFFKAASEPGLVIGINDPSGPRYFSHGANGFKKAHRPSRLRFSVDYVILKF